MTPYDGITSLYIKKDLMISSPAQNDPYAFDLDVKSDPYAFNIDAPIKAKAGKGKQNPYDFDIDEGVHDKKKSTSTNKFNSNIGSNSNIYDNEVNNKDKK